MKYRNPINYHFIQIVPSLKMRKMFLEFCIKNIDKEDNEIYFLVLNCFLLDSQNQPNDIIEQIYNLSYKLIKESTDSSNYVHHLFLNSLLVRKRHADKDVIKHLCFHGGINHLRKLVSYNNKY